MAGAGTSRRYEAAHRTLSVTICSYGDKPTGWLVTYKSNEKGDTRQVEAVLDRGEWATRADGVDDHVRALVWLARKLWGEMEARNG